uniref:Uncharacterized protein n=1 Tax=Onchocerca volvulus TaxID=6282 RepID=A0A8R1XYV3_ONCVO
DVIIFIEQQVYFAQVSFPHVEFQINTFALETSGSSELRTLSKLYLREMKELCLVEMIRLEDFGRTIRKCCKNIFVARLSGIRSLIMKSLNFRLEFNKKKQMVRTCLSCGVKKHFLRNSKYLTRNERDHNQIEIEKRQQKVSAEEVHQIFPNIN